MLAFKCYSEWLFIVNNALATPSSFSTPWPTLSVSLTDEEAAAQRGHSGSRRPSWLVVDLHCTAGLCLLAHALLQHHIQKSDFIISHHPSALNVTLSWLLLFMISARWILLLLLLLLLLLCSLIQTSVSNYIWVGVLWKITIDISRRGN
jgi:hypothetical protein